MPVPGGQRPGQVAVAADADGSRAEGVSPLDLAQVPAGERHRVLDHDHQVLFEPGMLVADLGFAVLDQQPPAPPLSG